MDHAIRLLYDFLLNMLRQPESASLDLSALPPELLPFGKTLTQLRDSFCRITGQAKEVAKGDYTQHIDFPPDFAEAFNSITAQLQASIENAAMERQVLLDSIRALDDTSWELEESNQELKNNLALVRALTDYTNNMIFVYSVDSSQEVHLNRSAAWFKESLPQAADQLIRRLIQQQPDIQRKIEQDTEDTQENSDHQDSVIWNIEVNRPGNDYTMFYQVESFVIPWFSLGPTDVQAEKRYAVVHIVMDETERKEQQNTVYRLAYVDSLTKLNNRRYAMEKMEQWLSDGVSFTLSFVDVDYLKYYNDTFGHEKGDSYLIEISNALQTLGAEVCRVGGDEFFLLQAGATPPVQDEKLERLRSRLLSSGSGDCPKSFSYASSLIPAPTDISLETYIGDADAKMYQYKQKYKLPLKDVLYRDERL